MATKSISICVIKDSKRVIKDSKRVIKYSKHVIKDSKHVVKFIPSDDTEEIFVRFFKLIY